MDHNPKKSKALLITIIAIVVLAIAAYFIFRGSGSLFGIKSGNTQNDKTFNPLLGTSKPKTTVDTNVINNSSQNVPTTDLSVPDSNVAPGSASSPSGQSSPNPSVISPAFNPLPPPPPIVGTTGISTTGTGISTTTPAQTPPAPTPLATASITSICPADDPLVFTEAENAQIADLLRQYYLIAPTLKTEDDIDVLDNGILNNKALVEQAKELTRDCKDEKSDLAYTGPQTIKNNPYYSDPLNTTLSYVAEQPSNFITTSEYYQSGYGAPVTSCTTGGVFCVLNQTIVWPDAYHGPKVMNYKDFEKMFKVW